jgi:hypothetical protein
LPAKQIFRAILGITAGKNQRSNRWIQLELAEYIPLPDFQHAKIRSVYLGSPAVFDNIADADFFPDEKILAFFYRFKGIIIMESETKDFIQNRPQHAVAAPVAEINIPLFEFSLRKPRRRQSPDN